MTLKKLTIDNVDLRYAADTYMKFIKFSALESLVVGGCAGADAVFAQMSKPHLRPNSLKKLRWVHEAAGKTHVLESLEGLLEAITGLEVSSVMTERHYATSVQHPIMNVTNRRIDPTYRYQQYFRSA